MHEDLVWLKILCDFLGPNCVDIPNKYIYILLSLASPHADIDFSEKYL